MDTKAERAGSFAWLSIATAKVLRLFALAAQWASTAQVGAIRGGHIQYIRTSTAGYLEAVLDQLWREDWTHAVIDTPAHQTASVFEAVGRSSLLVIPAQSAPDAKEIRDRLPDDLLIRSDRIRCLVAGSEQSQKVRVAFSPLPVLTSELPFDPAFAGFIPYQDQSTDQNTLAGTWTTLCIQLANEVLDLLSEQQDMVS